MRESPTETKNCFGVPRVEAGCEPVFVEKASQLDKSLHKRTKRINEQYMAWIDAQNHHVEQYGVFDEVFRVW